MLRVLIALIAVMTFVACEPTSTARGPQATPNAENAAPKSGVRISGTARVGVSF